MKTLRVMLTRAELIAAHLAMGVMWLEHKLDSDPDAKPLWSALTKFNTALETWDGEGVANLVLVAGGAIKEEERVKAGTLTAQAKVQKEVLVQWNCFCQPPIESCRYCQGSGHIESWMPTRLVTQFNDTTYMILGHREVHATPVC